MLRPQSRMTSMTRQPSSPSSSCFSPAWSVTWIIILVSVGLPAFAGKTPCFIDADARPQGARSPLLGLGDAELLLQLGGAGGVLEHDPLARRNNRLGGLGHQGRFVEAGKDKLQLARIGIDIADGKNAGHRGLELLGIDHDGVVVEFEP